MTVAKDNLKRQQKEKLAIKKENNIYQNSNVTIKK